MVKLLTNFGEITLELNAEKAPITVANFLQYVDSGFYNGTIFHRVIDTGIYLILHCAVPRPSTCHCYALFILRSQFQ